MFCLFQLLSYMTYTAYFHCFLSYSLLILFSLNIFLVVFLYFTAPSRREGFYHKSGLHYFIIIGYLYKIISWPRKINSCRSGWDSFTRGITAVPDLQPLKKHPVRVQTWLPFEHYHILKWRVWLYFTLNRSLKYQKLLVWIECLVPVHGKVSLMLSLLYLFWQFKIIFIAFLNND